MSFPEYFPQMNQMQQDFFISFSISLAFEASYSYYVVCALSLLSAVLWMYYELSLYASGALL